MLQLEIGCSTAPLLSELWNSCLVLQVQWTDVMPSACSWLQLQASYLHVAPSVSGHIDQEACGEHQACHLRRKMTPGTLATRTSSWKRTGHRGCTLFNGLEIEPFGTCKRCYFYSETCNQTLLQYLPVVHVSTSNKPRRLSYDMQQALRLQKHVCMCERFSCSNTMAKLEP